MADPGLPTSRAQQLEHSQIHERSAEAPGITFAQLGRAALNKRQRQAERDAWVFAVELADLVERGFLTVEREEGCLRFRVAARAGEDVA